MISIINNSRWLFVILFALIAGQAFGHGMSETEKQAIIDGGNLRYISIGATHMLSGYDHLAFVFGIIFFLTRFKDIVKYITAFTLGHSITLIIATFNAIQINYFLVDAIIALSVCYIAFHNLDGFKKYLNVKAPNMMGMIFSLGLIHGLGLSTRLQQLPLSEDNLLMNIISFNAGIEIGQIFALAIMLLLIKSFRNSHVFKSFSTASNLFLIFAGAYLFLMQMHGYEHNVNESAYVAESSPVNVVRNIGSEKTEWTDTISLTIPSRSDKEYKVIINDKTVITYNWKTDIGDLFFDFHGEPLNDKTGSFKSFLKDTQSQSKGTLMTSFKGTHGWYWKNNNTYPVKITLKLKGDYQRMDVNEEQKKKPLSSETYIHDSID